eukprot:679227-Amorphochlora_amoeboformis.AAC.1
MSSFLVGGLALSLAPNMITIIAARVVIGFASGFATVLVPVYMGELSPPSLRAVHGDGNPGCCYSFALVTHHSFCPFPTKPYVNAHVDVPPRCTTPEGWRYLFGVTPAVALVALFSLSSVKESPRWLPIPCLVRLHNLTDVITYRLYSHSTLPTIQRRFETARLLMQLRGFRDEQEVFYMYTWAWIIRV